MELRQIRYFHVVAEELHFSKAALRLHIDPSAVSKAIKLLEEELNTPLFIRNRANHIELTEMGKMFFQETQYLTGFIEQIKQRISLKSNRQHIKIVISNYINRVKLANVLRFYREKMIDVYLKQVTHNELINILNTPCCDIALSYSDKVLSTNIIKKRLWTEPLSVLLPSGHPLIEFNTLTVNELQAFKLICLPHYYAVQEQIIRLLNKLDFVPNNILHVESIDLLIAYVSSGFGIAVVPSCFYDKVINDPHIVIRQFHKQTIHIYALYKPHAESAKQYAIDDIIQLMSD